MHEVARPLTKEELGVLGLIRGHYGEQNTVEDVFWLDDDKAGFSIKASDGSIVLMSNITNLANWRAEGAITTEQLYDWLLISDT